MNKKRMINYSGIRRMIHDQDLMVSEGSLEKLNCMIIQILEKVSHNIKDQDRKILRPIDLKNLIPYKQLTFGPRRPPFREISRPERRDPGEETYITA